MDQPKRQMGRVIREPMSEDLQSRLLHKERKQLEEDRRRFKQEQQAFYTRQNLEKKHLDEEKHLFQMKWKILEGELQKLAQEKADIEIEKKRYFRGKSSRQNKVAGELPPEAQMFFSGVDDIHALKKRYKELIKIYHPDNMAGDTATLQMINTIYDSLKKQYQT
ncbi:MAG: molecular chaperone DnaJ [Lachnospiraceae bacterium]|nr:molecular chaperone DnaJ [Lachnospiraceae bacterium]